MSDDDADIKVHLNPIWRDRANFIIRGWVPGVTARLREQLWARQLADYEFEICCIPFYLYDVALGDVVETDDEHYVQRIVRRSRLLTYRIWLGDCSYRRFGIAERVEELGGVLEWYSDNYFALAVTAADEPLIAKYLLELKAQGIEFEPGGGNSLGLID